MSASIPLEREIQKVCLNWLLKSAKCFAWRQNSTGIFDREKGFFRVAPKRGAPDIIAIAKGRFIGIEVKRPGGGRQSDEQKWFQESVEAAGGEYWLVYSLADLQHKWYNLNA